MIAITKEHCGNTSTNSTAPNFEDLLPTICKQARRAFRTYSKDEQEELVAEVVANTFCSYQRLVQVGKGELIYSTPLANYAIKQVRDGRRVGTAMNANDVSSEWCHRKKQVTVERLDRYDSVHDRWQDVIVEDRSATPADIAATRIDFSVWLESLNPRNRKIALTLAAGETNKDAAKRFAVTSGRISQIRKELKNAWLLFQSVLATN